MADHIRLGIIGASCAVGWAHRSHLPAIAASPAIAPLRLPAAVINLSTFVSVHAATRSLEDRVSRFW